MRLYSFAASGARRLGAELRGQLIDLSVASSVRAAVRAMPDAMASVVPRSLEAWLRLGENGVVAARDALAFMARRPALPVGERAVYDFDEVRLLPPVVRPGKILCAAPAQSLRCKLASALVGSGSPLVCPPSVDGVTLDVCLAAILGASPSGGRVGPGTVAGYTLLLDVAAGGDGTTAPFLARNFDTFCPLGPALLLATEFQALSRFGLRLQCNGKPLTEMLVESPQAQLAATLEQLSAAMTLEAADVVAWRVLSSDRIWRPGDELRVEVDELGALEHRVENAPGIRRGQLRVRSKVAGSEQIEPPQPSPPGAPGAGGEGWGPR